jgi:fatty-acyl-CoA synthase
MSLIVLYAVTGSGRVLLLDPLLDERFASVTAPRRIVMDGRADAELSAVGAEREWPGVVEDAPATINYTSGTTTAPKGVVLTHRGQWLNAAAAGWAFGLGGADR